jgi:uncharacterized repeat protein (TIGR03803 family)
MIAKALFVAAFVGAAGFSAGSASAQPTETVLYSFCQQTNCVDGQSPNGGLIATSQGGLYGTTELGGSAASVGVAFFVSITGGHGILHQFQGGTMDGANPAAPLFRDKSGNFYGTTSGGGPSLAGTVFERSAAGTYRLRHAFNGSDGQQPLAGLIGDSAGNVYGTTNLGGANGGGTIFVLTPSGILKTLYSFCSAANCSDGTNPVGGLVSDEKGNFYGTTVYGGAEPQRCFGGCGTVFKIHADGTNSTVLYSFKGELGPNDVDAANPHAGLSMDPSGTLYGTTVAGGIARACVGGCGTVFKIGVDGSGYAVLHEFCTSSLTSCADGSGPLGGVILDASGNLYGTTQRGGANNKGVVFALMPSGTETVLYSFCSLASCADGSAPVGNLAPLGNGNLYGTTYNGGTNNAGTVYQLSGSGFVLPTSTAER